MTVLVRNKTLADRANAMEVPTRPDGTFYTFEMICDGGWSRVYDDTPSGLLSYLIPGYTEMDEVEKIVARIRHAVDNQVRLQARLNAFFETTDRTQTEDDILYGPRHIQPTVTQWDCAVPLVLVDAFYTPHTNVSRPFSGIADVAMPPNLWWLRPADTEIEYLRSLHEASIIDLHMAKDAVV